MKLDKTEEFVGTVVKKEQTIIKKWDSEKSKKY